MKMTRWLVLGAAVLLCSTLAVADTEPGHYTIQLFGFDPGFLFEFTPNPTGIDPADYQNPLVFCPGFDICGDPLIKFNAGGGSTPEDGTFSFSTDDATLDFDNAGAPITEVLLTLTDLDGNPVQLPADDLGEEFVCSSDIFQHCGFNNDAFSVLFDDPYVDGIPTATTPEPSQWMVLLLACAGLVVARARKARLTSICSQTRQ